MNKKLIVGITQGDGNGIGYEVIIKALADARILDSFTPVIYGSSKIFGFYRKTLHNIEQMDTNVITSAKDVHPKRINIVNCLPENVFVEPGQSTPEAAKSAIRSLECAVEDIKKGYIDVLVTAPINKKAMVREGFGYNGHTEYLENIFGVKEVTMLMVSDLLKVGVVTAHIPLKDVPGSLTQEKIVSKLRMMDHSLRRDFGIDEPRIASSASIRTAETAACWAMRSKASSFRPSRPPRKRASRPSVPILRTDSSAWGTTAASMRRWPCTMTRVWPRSKPSRLRAG